MKKILTIFIGLLIFILGCKSTPSDNDSDDSRLSTHGSVDFIAQSGKDRKISLLRVNGYDVCVWQLTTGPKKGDIWPDEKIPVLIKKNQAVLEKNPNDYQACIMLAGLYIDRGQPGDLNEAVKYTNMALALENNSPHAIYTRSIAYFKNNENDKAIKDIETLMEINLQSVKGAYYLMGLIYYKEEAQLRNNGNITAAAVKLDAAIDAFENVALFEPDFADIQEILKELRKRKN